MIDYEENDFMNPNHEKWDEFAERLEGPEGCNFRKDENEKIKWDCGSGNDLSKSEAILREMGFNEEQIEKSLQCFTAHGGYCDCEVLFNVEAAFWSD